MPRGVRPLSALMLNLGVLLAGVARGQDPLIPVESRGYDDIRGIASKAVSVDVLSVAPPELLKRVREEFGKRQLLVQRAERLYAQGKLQEAIDTAEQELAIGREIDGEFEKAMPAERDSLDRIHQALVIDTLYWLSARRREAGDTSGARKALNEVESTVSLRLGKDHWRARDARRALADLERYAQLDAPRRDEVTRAQRLYQEARQRATGGEHLRALDPAREAMQIRERILGKDELDTAVSVGLVGLLCLLRGETHQAVPLVRRALVDQRRVLGADHPRFAAALNEAEGSFVGTAQRLRGEKKLPAATEVAAAWVDLKSEALGQDGPGLLTPLEALAGLRELADDLDGARAARQRILNIRTAQRGKAHWQVTDARLSLEHINRVAALAAGERAELAAAELAYEQIPALWKVGLLGEVLTRVRRLRDIRGRLLGRDDPAVSAALCSSGTVESSLPGADSATAVRDLREALNLRKKTHGEKHPQYAEALEALAGLYEKPGKFSQAEPLRREAVAIYRGAPNIDDDRLVSAVRSLGRDYIEMRQFGPAKKCFEEAVETLDRVVGKETPDYAEALHDLGDLYLAMGDLSQAEPRHREASEIEERVLDKDDPRHMNRLNGLCKIYEETGQFERALEFRQKLLESVRSIYGAKSPGYAAQLINLATVHTEMKDYPKAEKWLKEALEILRAIGQDSSYLGAGVLNNLGFLDQTQGKLPSAARNFEQAAAVLKEVVGDAHPEYGKALNNQAYVCFRLGDYARAEPLYRRAHEIRSKALIPYHSEFIETPWNLGMMYVAMGRDEEAAPLLASVSRIRRIQSARVLTSLPEADHPAYIRAHHLQWYDTPLFIALTRSGNAAMDGYAVGVLLNFKGIAQQAIAERMYMARELPLHRPAVLDELGDVRAKLAGMANSQPPLGDKGDYRREFDRLSQQEEWLTRQILEIPDSLLYDPWVEPDEVRRAIPTDGVLVEFARFQSFDLKKNEYGLPRYAAWIIPTSGAGGISVVDLGPAESIEAAVIAARRALRAARPVPRGSERPGAATERTPTNVAEPERGLSFLDEPGDVGQLWKTSDILAGMILRPLLPHIGKAKRWIISPDGALWMVPWAALPLERGRYAIEQYTIQYLVSGRDLVRAKKKADGDAAGVPLIVADPDFDDGAGNVKAEGRAPMRWRRLPGTAAEARSVTPKLAVYFGQAPTVCTGAAATEAVVKAVRRPKALVLCTHGFFRIGGDPGPAADQRGKPAAVPNPLLQCGLVLAGANRADQRDDGSKTVDDSVLTGLEIVGLDLHGTEMVVLSACETGIGELRTGEAVASLRQAFQIAGAEAVIASLWRVPDAETASLMTTFWERLAAGQLKAEALRQAQLAAISTRRASGDRLAHPYFWAAFTLTGRDGSPALSPKNRDH